MPLRWPQNWGGFVYIAEVVGWMVFEMTGWRRLFCDWALISTVRVVCIGLQVISNGSSTLCYMIRLNISARDSMASDAALLKEPGFYTVINIWETLWWAYGLCAVILICLPKQTMIGHELDVLRAKWMTFKKMHRRGFEPVALSRVVHCLM